MAENRTVTTAVFRAEEQGVDKVVASLGKLRGTATQAGTATETFSRRTAAALRQVKADQEAAAKAMQGLVAPEGMKQIAVTTERNAAALRIVTKEAEKLQAKLDPVHKAAAQLAQTQSQLNALVDAGAISWQRHGELMDAANDRFGKFGNVANDAGEKVKLTSSQVQNLGFQLNDATTMLLFGSSPFQVMATQGGQVVQALQDGPGGVTGSIKAMATAAMGLLTPVNLIGAGLVTAAGAAIYFGTRSSAIKPLNDAMEAHKQALGDVADAYGLAMEKAEAYQRGSSAAFALRERRTRAELALSARSSLNEGFAQSLSNAFSGDRIFSGRIAGEGRAAAQVAEQFKQFEAPLMRIFEGMRKGNPDAATFVETIAQIANSDPANDELQKLATRLYDIAGPAADAQRQLQALALSLDGVTQAAQKTWRGSMESLSGMVPDLRTPAQQIEQQYQAAVNAATELAGSQRAMEGLLAEAARKRSAAFAELDKQEAQRRSGYELDLRAITARTAAEQAQIAYERAYGDALADNLGKEKAAQLANEARTLSLTESQHSFSEATRQRVEAGQAQVEQAQFELTLIGKSAGETARLRAEYDMLTAARQAAREAGTVVDPAEAAAIREQAAAIGELTAQTARINLGRDQAEEMRMLQAEAGLIHLNSDARQVALAGIRAEAELRRQGIALNDAWGQGYVENARQIATMENALDKQTEAFDNLRDAAGDFFDAIGSGKGILQSLVDAFAGLGKQMASDGFDKLFGGLFGSNGQQQSASRTGQILANMGQVSSYSAPLGRVERSVLPALDRTTTKFASNSNDLAENIQAAAQTLGVSARDLATVISFETGGTFSTSIRGGAGNNHIGLIQFGRAEQQRYGAAIGQTIAEQMEAVVGYLQDRGLKPGMGLLDIYSTVNAGRPGRYNASDAANGGTWGTVQDKVAYQMTGHAANADRVLSKAVSTGVVDAQRQILTGQAGLPRIDGGYAGYGSTGAIPTPTGRPQTGLFSQAGLDVLGAGIGIAANGYQSGNPLMGGLSGALGGFQAAGSIASAFPALAGVAGPLGLAAGAPLGGLGAIFTDERSAA